MLEMSAETAAQLAQRALRWEAPCTELFGALAPRMFDEHGGVRPASIRGMFKKHGAPALSIAVECMRRAEPEVSREIGIQLIRIKPLGQQALLELLFDPSTSTQKKAASVLFHPTPGSAHRFSCLPTGALLVGLKLGSLTRTSHRREYSSHLGKLRMELRSRLDRDPSGTLPVVEQSLRTHPALDRYFASVVYVLCCADAGQTLLRCIAQDAHQRERLRQAIPHVRDLFHGARLPAQAGQFLRAL